jgi:magnesium-transporting ATPase (P-type)
MHRHSTKAAEIESRAVGSSDLVLINNGDKVPADMVVALALPVEPGCR